MLQDGVVGIVSTDRMKAIQIATELRRAGIATETFLSGNFKKQMARCKDFEAVVMLKDDGATVIKDMITGNQMEVVGGDIAEQVKWTIDEGIYPVSISFEDALKLG